jgi:hypothetical protein
VIILFIDPLAKTAGIEDMKRYILNNNNSSSSSSAKQRETGFFFLPCYCYYNNASNNIDGGTNSMQMIDIHDLLEDVYNGNQSKRKGRLLLLL